MMEEPSQTSPGRPAPGGPVGSMASTGAYADEAERVETREKPSDRDQGDPDFLVIDDDDRYSRLRLISWWRQERLREATRAGRRRGCPG